MTLISALKTGLRLIVIVFRNLLVSLGGITLVCGVFIAADRAPHPIDSIIGSVSWILLRILLPLLVFAMFWFTNKDVFAAVTGRNLRYFLKMIFCLLFSFVFYYMLFGVMSMFS